MTSTDRYWKGNLLRSSRSHTVLFPTLLGSDSGKQLARRRRACHLSHPTRRGTGLRCVALVGLAAASGLPSVAQGWILAGSILTAVRLGRLQADRAHLESLQETSLEAWRDDQQALLAESAAQQTKSRGATAAAEKRMQEARQRAAKRQEELQAENLRIMAAAAKQKELAEKARSEEKGKYEAKEAELRAELEQRTQAQLQAREEALAKQRKVKEQQRRQAEKRRQERELERQEREREVQKQRQAELERKAVERREIERLSKSFAITLEGSLVLDIPPEGTQTTGRLPKDAIISVEVTAGTLVGGSGTPGAAVFASIAAAEAALPLALAAGAFHGAELYAASARLRKMMGEGPLQDMSEAEMTHWMRCAGLRAAAVAAPGAGSIFSRFGERRAHLSHPFKVRTERGVLPTEDARRTSSVLQRAVEAVEADNSAEAGRILEGVVEDESDQLCQDMDMESSLKHAGAALALAFFLDHMWQERPSKRMGASPWYEAASSLACRLLAAQVSSAPQDSLQTVASLLQGVLPKDHVILQCMERLAEKNMSAKLKAKKKAAEEAMQAEIAESLVQFEMPDRAEQAAIKLREIQESIPVPERIWALRNVGSTSALGGPEGRARARKLLDQAIALKRELVGGMQHPGMLPELEAMAKVLEMEKSWLQDAAALRRRMLDIISSIAESYMKAGDVKSGVALLEAVVKEYEQAIGMTQPKIVAASKRSNNLFDTLPSSEKEQVKAARRQKGLIQRVILAFEEQLASRQLPSALYKYESWNEQGVKWLGELLPGG